MNKYGNREDYLKWYEEHPHWGNNQVTENYERLFWLLPFVHGSVLEVGCNTGGITSIIATIPSVQSVLGIDITDDYINQARKATEFSIKASLHKLFLEDITLKYAFHTILLMEVLEHVLNPVEALKKCFSLLAPGGRILISVPEGHSFSQPDHIREYSAKSLYSDIAAASDGFDITTQIVETHSPYFDIEYYSWLLAVLRKNG